MSIRNIAIIAHVDHGKTSLVDCLFREAGSLSRSQTEGDRVMDSDTLEKERGITILSKNAAVSWKGVRINLIDTPGHADFGGQVERVLSMADGVLLVVDAFEGPMPQTRFVLRKAFEHRLQPLVVINKMDRPDARHEAVLEELFGLFVDLDADELALDFPTIYASARDNWASESPERTDRGVAPLLDAILEQFPAPAFDSEAPLRFQVSTLDWDDFVGRIGIGRVARGRLERGASVAIVDNDGRASRGRIKELFQFSGMGRVPVSVVEAGDIAALAGIEQIGLGDSLCAPDAVEPFPPISVEAPTIEMEFLVNDSPLAGQDGNFVTSRQVADRLERASQADPALRISPGPQGGNLVAGRGVLHLSILIERMRREGYEFSVGRPRVLLTEVEGRLMEPVEEATVEMPEDCLGRVIEFFGQRRAEIGDMERHGSLARLFLTIPTRGLIGARTHVLTLTRGEGTVHSVPSGHARDQGPLPTRRTGVLVSTDNGKVTAYALRGLEDRGTFFTKIGDQVYTGMVVGENNKEGDIDLNIVREKKLTNMRSSTKDVLESIRSAREMSLEAFLEYLADDELLEVTPNTLRMRKRQLNAKTRLRAAT